MKRLYTLKEAKKLLGVTTKTIQRWDREGKRVVRTIGGRRRILESEIKRIGLKEERVVGYVRVSSASQKDDLERQKQLIHSYAEKGYGEIEILSDVGSCLNERKGFLKLLEIVADGKISKVIVVHEDRLTIFGFETLRKMLQDFGTMIEVINSEEKTPKELVEDLMTIVSQLGNSTG